MEPTENEATKTESYNGTGEKGIGTKIVETLDAVIDDTGDLLGGTKVSKIAGGAAIGVIAGVVLPFSVLTGAVIGGAYAAWRNSARKDG